MLKVKVLRGQFSSVNNPLKQKKIQFFNKCIHAWVHNSDDYFQHQNKFSFQLISLILNKGLIQIAYGIRRNVVKFWLILRKWSEAKLLFIEFG